MYLKISIYIVLSPGLSYSLDSQVLVLLPPRQWMWSGGLGPGRKEGGGSVDGEVSMLGRSGWDVFKTPVRTIDDSVTIVVVV